MIFEQFNPTKDYYGFKQFCCGLKVIDKFVSSSLKKQVASNVSTAFVLLDTANNEKFVGFYTLMMSEISREKLTGVLAGSLPTRIGCARLVMLGLDQQYQKNPSKLGLQLLAHALRITKQSASLTGCRGMYLDADAGALGFYQKMGFTVLQNSAKPGDPTPMFLPIESFF